MRAPRASISSCFDVVELWSHVVCNMQHESGANTGTMQNMQRALKHVHVLDQAQSTIDQSIMQSTTLPASNGENMLSSTLGALCRQEGVRLQLHLDVRELCFLVSSLFSVSDIVGLALN
jgi:hypothetical protein